MRRNDENRQNTQFTPISHQEKKAKILVTYPILRKKSPNTVWKFHDFSITQILREINFGDSASVKSAILTHLEVLNFAFYEIMHLLKVKIDQLNKI